jgi:outer membrane protein assembly factor BamD (BamD/ComL family)
MFAYVAAQGKERPLYLNARIGMLDARNRKLLAGNDFTDADLKLLEKEYQDFLTEFGRTPFSAPVLRDLARLQAYHLNDYQSAIAALSELTGMQRLDPKFRAECKLELGDIYVLKGDEWEAMLLFGQVDKDYKEDPLGQEAKFRNARLSYYLGEFAWARAQLDVLKTATTQLIANNAIELSLIIQDNTVDSNEEPLRLFAKADLNYFQNRTDVALRILDSINLLYPRHSLDDDILFKRAQIAYKRKDYTSAINYLTQLLKENGTDILGDNALFMLAGIREKKLNDKAGAMALYEEFLERFPGSFFTTEARKRFRMLRGDQVN